jgi:hypothetical protein
MLEQEDLKWRQRAKEAWLRDGNRNTKFFHACATQRRQRNSIEHIVDRLGRHCENQNSVEQAFVDYFNDIFTSSMPYDVDTCTDDIKSRLTDSMKEGLTATYTAEEVHRALMQMVPLKAPGPDGFSADFYQQK